MFMYSHSIILYLLCIISSSVCNICLTCLCSNTINEGSVLNCQGKHLESNDVLNFELLMLEECTTFNKLILSNNNISNLPGRLLKNLQCLKKLDLSENLITDIYTEFFINLDNLEDLNLSKNKLTVFNDLLLEVLPALLSLDLSYNHISEIEYKREKALINLTFLNLSYNNISSVANMFFKSLSNLQYLDLSFNKIYVLEEDALIHLKSLKTIHINNNFLTSLHIKLFPKSLIDLYSGFNSITEVFPEPSKIKVLNIEYNQLSKLNSNLTILDHLQHLNVSGNLLSNFPDILLEDLKILDVSYNNLSYIPETISIKNFPLLLQLNVSNNPIKNLTFPSDLKLHSFVANNISLLKTIEKDTLKKLIAPPNNCVNITLSNNKMLSFVHEEALKHLLQNLCYLDLSNNKITYISQKLIAHNSTSMIYKINLQGNPFKCNCSLQWMLNDLVPYLYSAHPHLLNNLRCTWPLQISNRRMVHWYGWKDKVFCGNVTDFTEELTISVASVLNNDKVITLDSSRDVLIILGSAITVLTILVIIGIIWTWKLSIKRRRRNRKF
ncbi:uncharacterized protein LOC143186717 [Calliopsis andreniformis]|uniref:uncharacterized protein LOC143186717 n=1 Tax=Calliopsis andreniformis TaxID=337506 RepID=UPI003FCD7207